MNPDKEPTHIEDGEQNVAEYLASFDEFLKTGEGVHPSQPASPPGGGDVQRAQDCLRLMEAVWPRPASAKATSRMRRGVQEIKHVAAAPVPAQLGRFQVRRELGRGGFGAVYHAFDPQLGREVALKVPHPHVLADAELRTRFEHEARAAAVLDHANIVPVYETGAINEVAYIALAYCPGITLADWLRERAEPVPFVDAAGIVAALADAVQHAHDRGVVHRDLKPANVMLVAAATPGNASAGPDVGVPTALPLLRQTPLSGYQPKITDFGLAKHLDATATLTLSGTILGTPCYMAPEQASASSNQSGPPADVYSLGAILYELLTAQPPFHGDTPLETLHQVRYEDAVPPSRLRRSVPTDLSTICLKCLDKDPLKRFRSASALAEDLRRYLDGRPILARPLSRLGRMARWCRRKPVIAALLATLTVAIMSGLSGVVWQWQRAEAALDVATSTAGALKNERDRVVAERDRAERNLTRARNLVERMTRLANQLSGQPGLDATGRKILQEALVFHEEVLQEKGSDPGVRFDAACGYGRVGNIFFTLREWDQAEDAYRQAIELLDGLHAEFPESSSYRTELAYMSRFCGHVLRDAGKSAEAHVAYERAIAVEEKLVAENPTNAMMHMLLGNSLLNSRSVLPAAKRNLGPERIRRAAELQREAVRLAPHGRNFRQELALVLVSLADLHAANKEFDEAASAIDEAVQLRLEVNHEKRDRENERYLSMTYRSQAKLLMLRNRREDAIFAYRQGVKLMEELVADFPTRPYVRKDLADMQKDLAGTLAVPEELGDVERLIAQAIKHYERLAADHPKEPVHLRGKATAAHLLGQRYKAVEDFAAALNAFAQMLAANERLIELFREDQDRNNRGWDLWLLSDTQERAGNLTEAEKFLRQSALAFQSLADERPDNVEYARSAATRHHELNRLLRKAGAAEPARAARRAATAAWQRLVDRFNQSGDRKNLAASLADQGEDECAARNYTLAAQTLRAAVQAAPESSRGLNALAWFLATCPEKQQRAPAEARQLAEQAVKLSPKDANVRNTLGVACFRAGAHADAVTALEEAIRLRGRGSPEDWFFQAMARWHLNDKQTARRDYQRGVDWLQENVARSEEINRFRAEAAALLGITD